MCLVVNVLSSATGSNPELTALFTDKVSSGVAPGTPSTDRGGRGAVVKVRNEAPAPTSVVDLFAKVKGMEIPLQMDQQC